MKRVLLLAICLVSFIGNTQELYSSEEEIVIPIEIPEVSLESCIMIDVDEWNVFEPEMVNNVAFISLQPYHTYVIWINGEIDFTITANDWEIMDERDLAIQGIPTYYFTTGILTLEHYINYE